MYENRNGHYFDHKHVKEDNPAEHTDNPMQVF
jgi:hypothetical protein